MKVSFRSLVVAAALLLPSVASAQVIDFEDLGLGADQIVPGAPGNGYRGYNWNMGGGGVISQPYGGVTYPQSSGIVAMYINSQISMSSPTPFSIATVNFSAFQSGLSITAEGWLAGVLQYSSTYAGSTSSAPLYTLGYANIDEFRIIRDGDSGGTVFADDIVVGVSTPEPASLILMATGLLGVGVAVRRRKR